MDKPFLFIFLLTLAYLIGSLSTAVMLSSILGYPDPRKSGSKNPGATNMLRIAGKKAAIFTLLGDAIKAYLPIIFAKITGLPLSLQAWILFAACCGHCFPIFLKFKGGKGVATALGGFFLLSWPIGLMGLACWLLLAKLSRYASLASILMFIFIPLVFFLYFKSLPLALPCLSLLIISQHYKNILQLLRGKEKKL